MGAQQKIIQSVAELLIPLLGYFYWNWDVHFIFLFFYLDLIAFQLVNFYKWQKIVNFRGVRHGNSFVFFIYCAFLFIVAVALLEISVVQMYPTIHLYKSLLHFIQSREWGVPQLLLLIPLIGFSNYQLYKMTFIHNGAYRNQNESAFKQMVYFHFIALVVGALIVLCLSYAIDVAGTILLVLLMGKLIFDLYLLPNWENRTKKL
jgi:hypothetical protein